MELQGHGTRTGISVSGEGKAAGRPDTMTLTLGVSILDKSVELATAEARRRAGAVFAALIEAGVGEDDIQTSWYSVWPDWDYKGGGRRLRGYRASNDVTLKTCDVENAGRIIDAAVAAGGNATTVGTPRFTIEDDSGMLELARLAAWNDARGKAEQLARLSGVRLGVPLEIVESPETSPSVFLADSFAESGSPGDTPVRAGMEELVVSLRVRFAIEP